MFKNSNNDIFQYITKYACLDMLKTLLSINNPKKKKKIVSYIFLNPSIKESNFIFTCKEGWNDGFEVYLETGYLEKPENKDLVKDIIKYVLILIIQMIELSHQNAGIIEESINHYIQVFYLIIENKTKMC